MFPSTKRNHVEPLLGKDAMITSEGLRPNRGYSDLTALIAILLHNVGSRILRNYSLTHLVVSTRGETQNAASPPRSPILLFS